MVRAQDGVWAKVHTLWDCLASGTRYRVHRAAPDPACVLRLASAGACCPQPLQIGRGGWKGAGLGDRWKGGDPDVCGGGGRRASERSSEAYG